jgi:LCP family protein required for cell wall assembly
MSIFNRNKDILIKEEGDKTPVKFDRKNRLNDVEKKERRKKIRRGIIITLVVLILGGVGFFGWQAYSSIKNIFASGSGNILSLLTGGGQKLKGQDNGRTNILLLGVGDEGHGGSTLSDTIQVASIDWKDKKIAMISIPRDLYVSIPGYGYSKINSAHAFGEQKGGKGPELAMQTVEKVLDIPIHYYVRIDFSGLKDIVDSLGGVTVTVDNTFCDYNYPTEYKGDTRKVCFTKGAQTMNGIKALQFSRSRHALGPEGSDFARSKRQQKVIMAIKEKALSANTAFNPKKVLDLMNALGKHLKTDFQLAEISSLYDVAKMIDSTKLITKNLDNSVEGMLVSSSSAATGYILQPRTGNFDAIHEMAKNIFDSVSNATKKENAVIQVQNGTSVAGLGSKAATSIEALGLTVGSTKNAIKRTYLSTVIYDYTNGTAPNAIKALEKKFGKSSIKKTGDIGYDIVVIVGKDYK